jgi:hypothetical protein
MTHLDFDIMELARFSKLHDTDPAAFAIAPFIISSLAGTACRPLLYPH